MGNRARVGAIHQYSLAGTPDTLSDEMRGMISRQGLGFNHHLASFRRGTFVWRITEERLRARNHQRGKSLKAGSARPPKCSLLMYPEPSFHARGRGPVAQPAPEG